MSVCSISLDILAPYSHRIRARDRSPSQKRSGCQSWRMMNWWARSRPSKSFLKNPFLLTTPATLTLSTMWPPTFTRSPPTESSMSPPTRSLPTESLPTKPTRYLPTRSSPTSTFLALLLLLGGATGQDSKVEEAKAMELYLSSSKDLVPSLGQNIVHKFLTNTAGHHGQEDRDGREVDLSASSTIFPMSSLSSTEGLNSTGVLWNM